ncbi:alpha/beta hydrolase [Streptomyces sp. NBC_00445]|uniref:alpha/beta hydrolase n=1 Tax=Streptomyces sp. NBC_00445 TaxID=2975745 RepID=UPI002E228EAA
MPDDVAARAAAEEESAFSHPPVDPDATAAYGDHHDQVIDFYAPRTPEPAIPGVLAPLIVILHGGAWRAPYDRRHMTPFADFLARRGFAVANVEYRRGGRETEGTADAGAGATGDAGPGATGDAVPGVKGDAGAGVQGGQGADVQGDPVAEAKDDAVAGMQGGQVEGEHGDPVAGERGPVAGRWPDTFDDVAAAVDALPALVREILPQADARRMVVTGHSAGGHLALWVAARHLLPADAPWYTARPAPLRGVVALAPIADFAVAEKLDVCGGAVRQLLGDEEEFVARRPYADPALLLPTGIATTLVQGRTDIDVPQAVAESYADAAAKAGEVVGLTLLEDVGHFPLIDPAADACAVVAEEIAQLAW